MHNGYKLAKRKISQEKVRKWLKWLIIVMHLQFKIELILTYKNYYVLWWPYASFSTFLNIDNVTTKGSPLSQTFDFPPPPVMLTHNYWTVNIHRCSTRSCVWGFPFASRCSKRCGTPPTRGVRRRTPSSRSVRCGTPSSRCVWCGAPTTRSVWCRKTPMTRGIWGGASTSRCVRWGAT